MQLTSVIGTALPLSSVFLAATLVTGAPTIDPHKTVPTHSITPDGTCGPTSSGTYSCKEGYCCSKWGWW